MAHPRRGAAARRAADQFALLLNLVGVANAEDKATLWAFIRKYAPEATPETQPLLDQLMG